MRSNGPWATLAFFIAVANADPSPLSSVGKKSSFCAQKEKFTNNLAAREAARQASFAEASTDDLRQHRPVPSTNILAPFRAKSSS
jgi:hypothetical protein